MSALQAQSSIVPISLGAHEFDACAFVLASPDLDLDAFSSSVQRIGSLAPKITVISATNDRALALSGWLAGGITRVGAAETAQMAGLGLRVIDASQRGWGVINHDLFLSNAQIQRVYVTRLMAIRIPEPKEIVRLQSSRVVAVTKRTAR